MKLVSNTGPLIALAKNDLTPTETGIAYNGPMHRFAATLLLAVSGLR